MSLLKILCEKTKLTDREKDIADFILRNSEIVVEMSSRELAVATLTNSTIIVRFVKKLGYKSYNDFKMNLLYDLKNNPLDTNNKIEISKDENVYTILNKLSNLHEKVIDETKRHINIDQLLELSNWLKEVEQIDFFAVDANRSIAENISHNLFLIGKKSTVYDSIDKILLYDKVHQSSSVIIILTRLGMDKNISKAMLDLRKTKYKTVCICSNTNSLIVKRSNVFIQPVYIESVSEFGEIMYRISVSYILDLLLSLVIKEDIDKAIDVYNQNNIKYED